MKRITLCTIALLAASSARAQFTDLEKGELKKPAQVSWDLGGVVVKLAELGNRAAAVPMSVQVLAFQPQAELKAAIEACGAASEYFAGVGTRFMPQNLPRTSQVAGAFTRIDQCITRLQNARPGFQALSTAWPSQASNVANVDAAIGSLQSMNRGLTYATPWVGYPDIANVPLVGNHGDLELTLQRHASINLYATGIYQQLMAMMREIDGATSGGGVPLANPQGTLYQHYGDALNHLGIIFQQHAATWLASLDVILDSERTIIANDQAAGSGFRGFDFHRVLRQFELIGAHGSFQKQILGGGPGNRRNAASGMGQQFYLIQFMTTHLQGLITVDDLAMGPDPDLDAAALRARITELQRRSAVIENVYFAIDSAWLYVDAVRDSYMLFFHSLSLPPSVCLEPNVCVPPGVGAPCPTGQSCTVPPSPPPVCPTYIPLPVGSGTPVLEVRCVQQ